jgi:hypothetical protein
MTCVSMIPGFKAIIDKGAEMCVYVCVCVCVYDSRLQGDY